MIIMRLVEKLVVVRDRMVDYVTNVVRVRIVGWWIILGCLVDKSGVCGELY